ncbi:MAG: hypothetical protein NUV67_01985, partial [archaeon]|nr:hypothetical protein [archaeon]
LKTILYTSTARDPDKTIYDEGAEIDYLLAIVKEDFADNPANAPVLGDTESRVLAKTIKSILSPIQDSVDYAFYIRVPNQEKVVYFFIHATNFRAEQVPELGRNYYAYQSTTNDPSTPEDESHANYFCAIPTATYEGYNGFMKRLDRLLVNVGPVSQAVSVVKLAENSNDKSIDAQVDLKLWDATWLGETRSRNVGLFYQTDPQDPLPEWSCVSAD